MDFLIVKVPKGTRDIIGPEAQAFSDLERVARYVFSLFHFLEIRTPLFEAVELFSRSLGETSDVVEKEMFTFTDRGERTYALRPEGTAGVVRSFIENSLFAKGGLNRFFYMGPMFRAERPQAGRFRQFWQIGSECFGSPEPSLDADTVLMVAQIFDAYGVHPFSIHVNSLGCDQCRPVYRDALLKYLKSRESGLSEESRRRMAKNPLRVLDSKVDGPKLADAPAMKAYLCADCQAHHAAFLKLVKKARLPIEENPRLVRGLDYYTRTVFEFVSPDLGAQSALAAGGRYDNLVELLEGPATPAVGFALGMDRAVLVRLKKEPAPFFLTNQPNLTAMVIPLFKEALEESFLLAQELRKGGIAVPPVMANKKLKNQLSLASEMGAAWALLIGEDELQRGSVTIKNLKTREQSTMSLAQAISFITASHPLKADA